MVEFEELHKVTQANFPLIILSREKRKEIFFKKTTDSTLKVWIQIYILLMADRSFLDNSRDFLNSSAFHQPHYEEVYQRGSIKRSKTTTGILEKIRNVYKTSKKYFFKIVLFFFSKFMRKQT